MGDRLRLSLSRPRGAAPTPCKARTFSSGQVPALRLHPFSWTCNSPRTVSPVHAAVDEVQTEDALGSYLQQHADWQQLRELNEVTFPEKMQNLLPEMQRRQQTIQLLEAVVRDYDEFTRLGKEHLEDLLAVLRKNYASGTWERIDAAKSYKRCPAEAEELAEQILAAGEGNLSCDLPAATPANPTFHQRRKEARRRALQARFPRGLLCSLDDPLALLHSLEPGRAASLTRTLASSLEDESLVKSMDETLVASIVPFTRKAHYPLQAAQHDAERHSSGREPAGAARAACSGSGLDSLEAGEPGWRLTSLLQHGLVRMLGGG